MRESQGLASGQRSGSGDTSGHGQGLEVPPWGQGQGLEMPGSAPSRAASRRAWEWLEDPSPEPGASPLGGPLS